MNRKPVHVDNNIREVSIHAYLHLYNRLYDKKEKKVAKIRANASNFLRKSR